MKIWGLRRWDLRVEVLVSSDIDVEVMPALQSQLRTLLPEKNPTDPVWTSLLREPQGRRILRARIVLTAGSPGVAVDRALELLQAVSHALDVGVADVEQVSVTPLRLSHGRARLRGAAWERVSHSVQVCGHGHFPRRVVT